MMGGSKVKVGWQRGQPDRLGWLFEGSGKGRVTVACGWLRGRFGVDSWNCGTQALARTSHNDARCNPPNPAWVRDVSGSRSYIYF